MTEKSLTGSLNQDTHTVTCSVSGSSIYPQECIYSPYGCFLIVVIIIVNKIIYSALLFCFSMISMTVGGVVGGYQI